MDLFGKINEFYLASFGVIKGPPAMVSKLSHFVAGAFASFIMNKLEESNIEPGDPLITKELNTIKQVFQIYISRMGSTSVINIKSSFHDFIPFDFSGWQAPFGDAWLIKQLLKKQDIEGINLEVYFVPNSDTKATWHGNDWTLKIYLLLPPLVDIVDFKMAALHFPEAASDIRNTIEHELIHMVQRIGTYVIKNVKTNIGLPPMNVRHPDYDPYGFQREDVDRTGTNREHALQDIEFYSNVSDIINEYKDLLIYIPEELRDEFLRIFLGTKENANNLKLYPLKIRDKVKIHPVLERLKKQDEKRWKLAVKKVISGL